MNAVYKVKYYTDCFAISKKRFADFTAVRPSVLKFVFHETKYKTDAKNATGIKTNKTFLILGSFRVKNTSEGQLIMAKRGEGAKRGSAASKPRTKCGVGQAKRKQNGFTHWLFPNHVINQ